MPRIMGGDSEEITGNDLFGAHAAIASMILRLAASITDRGCGQAPRILPVCNRV